MLQEPELQLVLSAYANNMLLIVQNPGDLLQVEACQAVYLAASSAWVNRVKSSGLVSPGKGSWRLACLLEKGLQHQAKNFCGDKVQLLNNGRQSVSWVDLAIGFGTCGPLAPF
ncbi:unnamed protein product [Caretta caretta]